MRSRVCLPCRVLGGKAELLSYCQRVKKTVLLLPLANMKMMSNINEIIKRNIPYVTLWLHELSPLHIAILRVVRYRDE